MTTTLLVQNILNGIAIGSVYAIFAIGYTLVFSVLRVINFSHSAIFTLGAYFTYVLTGSAFSFNGLFAGQALPFGLPFPIAMILGGVLAGFCGIALERIAFRPLRKRGADPLLGLVSSLGIAVAVVNLIQALAGAELYSYPTNPFGNLPGSIAITIAGLDHPARIRTINIIIFAVAIVGVVLLTVLINYTKIGKALQAISEDPITASLLGINPDRLIVFTFFLSGFLGGIAGSLVGVSVSIAGPYFGITFGLKGLSVIILGGLTSIPGAVLGGFVIGLAETIIPSFLPQQYQPLKDAIPFIIMFLILLIRPQGLLGKSQTQRA